MLRTTPSTTKTATLVRRNKPILLNISTDQSLDKCCYFISNYHLLHAAMLRKIWMKLFQIMLTLLPPRHKKT